MNKISIKPLNSSYLPAIAELQAAYSAIYPDAPVIPGEVYLSPAYEDGRNLFCAIDDRGQLVGYAPLYPVLMRDASDLPHTLWTEIKVHPKVDAPNEIKDCILEQILIRAREVTQDFPGHPIHLTFQYFPSETASVEYVQSKGCKHTESIFTMRRDLTKELPAPLSIENIVMRAWKMESETEQQMYIDVRNQCFPEAPTALGEWQYFMMSPMWAVGTTYAAFSGEQLVGNTAVFWNEEENTQTEKKIGYTEYIFVHPDWRGKNIARELIKLGLKHLKDYGLEEAHLEVKALNQYALRLYQGLGFEVIRESRFYVLSL
jgi:ribosomal protein S18 acetylase RimI-like enzyme